MSEKDDKRFQVDLSRLSGSYLRMGQQSVELVPDNTTATGYCGGLLAFKQVASNLAKKMLESMLAENDIQADVVFLGDGPTVIYFSDSPDTQTGWFYCNPLDCEWQGPVSSRDLALSKGREDAELLHEPQFTICEAKYVPLKDDVFCASTILERWRELNNTDYSDLRLARILRDKTEEATKELEDALRDVFAAWRQKHKIGADITPKVGRILHKETVPVIRFPKEHELGGL